MAQNDFDPGGGVPGWLLGRWRLLRADAALDFTPGGGLTSVMHMFAPSSAHVPCRVTGPVIHVTV